ncbi:tail assembly protein [Escherichia coli]|nr:tail assembly protein [Escherichia coli]EHK1112480.1 tail assembly protein [Escherichia coli]EIG9872075.1 tail assembly protein [Escherichia coli]EIH0089339.1 tail assembly protein [Escherichia coli]EIH0174484.1 tail assembly protein [Escherichia coli]
MAATHTLPLASSGMARICLYGDLQRFGRRIDLRVKTGAEAIRALGEMRVGSRVVSQEISTADEGDGGQVVVIGR